MLRRTTGLLAATVLLASACGSGEEPPPPAPPTAAPLAKAPPEVPAALRDQPAPADIVLPPEFDVAGAQGFRTVTAGAGADGASRDSWELLGDRLATLWRDEAGAEYVTAVETDGTPVWHTELPELLEPAGERPVQPILERVHTAGGPDWLVVTSIGVEQPAGPITTRVLTLNADSGDVGLDIELPTGRVGVDTSLGHLSLVIFDEEYVTNHRLLIDLRTGEQQRLDNPETRTEDFVFLDQIVGVWQGEPIYLRECRQILAPPTPEGIACPQTFLYDGQAYDTRSELLPLPDRLLDTETGQQLLADDPQGRQLDLPCSIRTTRGVPESPSGRFVVVDGNLVDLQTNAAICGEDALWWTAVDDEGRGWGRRDGTTTLRVAYHFADRSISLTDVPGAQTPLAITRDRQGVFAATAEGTELLLLAPQ